MEKLINYLQKKLSLLKQISPTTDVSEETIKNVYAVYPFNRFEYIFVHLKQISTRFRNNGTSDIWRTMGAKTS